MSFKHTPVLLDEVITSLNLQHGSVVVDATVGGGGHSQVMLEKILPNGKLHAFDQDINAITEAKRVIASRHYDISFHNTNFANIKKELAGERVDAILADLGVSSHQIDTPERGFSYMHDAELDMRMDASQKMTGSTIVNNARESELVHILSEYGEERFAKRIAASIIRARPIKTTGELAKICVDSVPSNYWKFVGHPAKKTFQAIRIAVNRELDVLEKFLHDSVDILKPQGRIAVITFHSLEDRIVKNIFRHYSLDCTCPPKTPQCICNHRQKLRIITRKPVIPSTEEIKNNPRSASAKLRVAERIA